VGRFAVIAAGKRGRQRKKGERGEKQGRMKRGAPKRKRLVGGGTRPILSQRGDQPFGLGIQGCRRGGGKVSKERYDCDPVKEEDRGAGEKSMP